jgi:hypothetical protein
MNNSQNKVFRPVLVKSAKSSTINFDPNSGGRNEVQKNYWTPYCQTEFHGESEKKPRFYLENFYF